MNKSNVLEEEIKYIMIRSMILHSDKILEFGQNKILIMQVFQNLKKIKSTRK